MAQTGVQATYTLAYKDDGLQRLTGADASVGADYTYSYDLAGNRTDGGRTYNAANQVSGWQYDAAGNLTNDGTRSYEDDALNRLTQQGATQYAYNGDGTLVQAGNTRYTQDLLVPLTQVLNDGSANYLYGLDRLAAQTGVSRTWYSADALGSVRQTLSNSGAVLSAVQYDPWGVVEAGSAAPFGFTGELSDGGLVHLRARWYNPASSTFISRDPFAGFAETPYSQHSYQYAYSNPALLGDPSGRSVAVNPACALPLVAGPPGWVVGALCEAASIAAVVVLATAAIGTVGYMACGTGAICPSARGATSSFAPPSPGVYPEAKPKTVVAGTDYVPAPSPTPKIMIPAVPSEVVCPQPLPLPTTPTPTPWTPTPTPNPRQVVVELGPGIITDNLIALSARFPSANVYGVDNGTAQVLEYDLAQKPNTVNIDIIDESYSRYSGPLQNQADVVVAVAPQPSGMIEAGIRNFVRPGGQVLVVTDQDMVKDTLMGHFGSRAILSRIPFTPITRDRGIAPQTSLGLPLVSDYYSLSSDRNVWEIYVPSW